jgi:hypothetical protein
MSNISSDEQALRNELAALYALHDTAVTDRDRYREALEPFARLSAEFLKYYEGDDGRAPFGMNNVKIRVRDLRRAVEVLREDDGR